MLTPGCLRRAGAGSSPLPPLGSWPPARSSEKVCCNGRLIFTTCLPRAGLLTASSTALFGVPFGLPAASFRLVALTLAPIPPSLLCPGESSAWWRAFLGGPRLLGRRPGKAVPFVRTRSPPRLLRTCSKGSSPRPAAPRFLPGASSPIGEACSRSCFPLQRPRGASRPVAPPALLAGGAQRDGRVPRRLLRCEKAPSSPMPVLWRGGALPFPAPSCVPLQGRPTLPFPVGARGPEPYAGVWGEPLGSSSSPRGGSTLMTSSTSTRLLTHPIAGRAAGYEFGRWGLGAGTQTLSAWQTRTDRTSTSPA